MGECELIKECRYASESLLHNHIDMHVVNFFFTRDVFFFITVIVLVFLLDLLNGIGVPGLLVELREYSSVQRHANGIVLLNKIIKHALHETVGA
jgi:hypothetical protein